MHFVNSVALFFALFFLLFLHLYGAKAHKDVDEARPPSGLGINCLGSGLCRGTKRKAKGKSMLALTTIIYKELPDDDLYAAGEQIACYQKQTYFDIFDGRDTICALMQNTADGVLTDGKTIKRLMTALIDHGCQCCGSVPIT
jgi:hypothetical protein